MQDRIEKTVELNASISRVWRALTDHEQFGEWFRVDLDGPFVVGEESRGRMTHPECDHVKWLAKVRTMEPERLFVFTWQPHVQDPDAAGAEEPEITVTFRLEATATGTRLMIVESGFSALPEGPRLEAIRSNTKGWDEQARNIAAYVAA